MTVAIVIAKGSSNRIPHKNKKEFCGMPLFMWSVEQALYSKEVLLTYVTSDDESILYKAVDMGAEAILRPHEYTLTPANHAFKHALSEINKRGIYPDSFLGILPTSPVRLPWDMDNLIKLHNTHNDGLTTTVCDHLETILWTLTNSGKMKCDLYDKTGRYFVDGGGLSMADVDWYETWEVLDTDKDYDQAIYDGKMSIPDRYNYVMKEWQTPELDTMDHWDEAEAIMEHCIIRPYGRECYKNYFYSEGENNG